MGLRFFDTEHRTVVRVRHSTGWTAFGADRWSIFNSSNDEMARIDKQANIWLGAERVGSFQVGRSYDSAVVLAMSGAQIAEVSRLPRKHGWTETYGYKWRLVRTGQLDESFQKLTLACLGGLILARMADVRVG